MTNDAAYARLCQEVFDLPGLGDEFACHAGVVGGVQTLCFRGTKTWQEWLLDLWAFPTFDLHTPLDQRIGPIHGGFLDGATKLYPQAAKFASGRPFALCGHSLGGALATVVGALLVVNRVFPAEIVTFGAPRAGMWPLRDVLQGIPVRQYRYCSDPVPLVPPDPFMHAREPLIQLGHSVGMVFNDHHIANYIGIMETRYADKSEAPSHVGV